MSTATTNQRKPDFVPVWVIVENPGTDEQEVLREWGEGCMGEAMRALGYYKQNDSSVDLMKRLPDGTLTTEF